MKKLIRNFVVLPLVGALAFMGVASAQVVSDAVSGGGISQIDTSCGVSGGPITTTGTIQGAATPNAQTGTSYAIQNSDCGKLLTLSNSSPVAVSIAQAGGSGDFASGWFVTVINEGAGVATITPTTSTIDGAASLTLSQNQSVDLFSDGSNYFTARGRPGNLTGDCVTSGLVSTCNAPHPDYVANLHYSPVGMPTTATGNNPGQNTIHCTYGIIPKKVTISDLSLRIATLAAGGNVQLAIYQNSSGRPGTKIVSTGSQSTASTGTFTISLGGNKQLGPGGADGGRSVWFCSNVDNNTVAFTAYGATFPNPYLGTATAGPAIANNTIIWSIVCSGANCNGGSSTFNTWPSDLSGSTWSDDSASVMPAIAFKVASFP